MRIFIFASSALVGYMFSGYILLYRSISKEVVEVVEVVEAVEAVEVVEVAEAVEVIEVVEVVK